MQEAAFQLADIWKKDDNGMMQDPQSTPEEDGKDAAGQPLDRLAFEPEVETLSPDLALILKKIEKGEKLDSKSFLEQVPAFREIKLKAHISRTSRETSSRNESV